MSATSMKWWEKLTAYGKTQPPPYSQPGSQDAWRAGYRAALDDLAEWRTDAETETFLGGAGV